MPSFREFIPDCLKQYIRMLAAKLRYPACFIGTPFMGKRVMLGKGCSISRAAEVGNDVRIGDFSYVNCGAIIASGKIGRFCSIGPYALIGLADHPTNYLSTSPLLYGGNNIFRSRNSWNDFPSPPEIGSDVWIGAQAFVRQGVRIGSGAIVGAGAIVTRDVPPFGIVAGVPAKLIRYRFEPLVVEQLLRERWWELDRAELAKWQERFCGPVDELELLAEEEELR